MRISDWSSDVCSSDLETVSGPDGVLSGARVPKIISDSSTVSIEASKEIRAACEAKGVAFLASPISGNGHAVAAGKATLGVSGPREARSEEHTSELQSLMRISYAVFRLKKKNTQPK